jgi:2-phosphoglycolate phosphatase
MTAKKIKAILFDLDGTLLDTASDLGHALNHVLSTRNVSPLDLELIRPAAGRGCKGLLKLGLNIDETHADYSELCKTLLAHYEEHLADTTLLFAGMEEVLQHLEKIKMPWGIVTNKPDLYTQKLIAALQLQHRAACIVSGDTLKTNKPHPESILHGIKLLGMQPAECLYVGDSEIDIIASRAAGSPVLAALYGYIPSEETPARWQADGYIKHPREIIEWLAIQ